MSFLRYTVGALLLTIVSSIIMYTMVDLLRVHYLVSFWSATVVVFFMRYFLMDKYVFSRKEIHKQ